MNYVVKFSKPYVFEGNEYSEIDLSGIEKLTIQDAIDAQRQLIAGQDYAAAYSCETATSFARHIAAKVTELPVEFFALMSRGQFKRIHSIIYQTLNVKENTENHVMKLEHPVSYKGVEYTEIDLNGVAELNTLNESEAERRVVHSGFSVTGDNGLLFLYNCVVAAMATGIPEEFFTSLPFCETIKLKAAVNDRDFFV